MQPSNLLHRRTLSAFNIAATCIAATMVALVGATNAGAQTSEGLSSEATYHYELAEDDVGVDVTIDLAVTNIKPNRSSSRGTTQYYFTGYFISIPENAIDLEVTQDGSTIEFERIAEGDVDVLDIDFRRNIFYGSTANVDISFTLSSGGPRSALPVRINAAYAGFEIWTTPSVDTATVTIDIPAGFESDRFISGASTRANDDGGRTMTIDAITPEDFLYDYVALRNDANLTKRTVEVDGIEVEIQHWPNDSAWADFVEDRIMEDLPVLIDTIGQPWPLDETLLIQESFSPALSGYGGWYDPIEHIIEIGDEFDDQLLLHELTHIWANADLFASLWITEGLAEELASIVNADGEEPVDPEPTSLVDANARPLLEWGSGSYDPDFEVWSYGASWTVTREITNIIGADGLRSIIDAATNRELPYSGETEPETFSTLPTWKNYLDWIQELSGDAEVEDLFRDWVVPPRFHDQLDERADARLAYSELTDAGGDWANPLLVRDQMTQWDFADAEQSIADAMDVLAQRDRAIETATALDVALPDDARLAYQGSDEDLASALTLTTELADQAQELEEIQELFDADRSFFTNIGLIGVDPADDRAAAFASFEAGAFDDMTSAGDSLDATLDSAEGAGQLRVGLAAAALLLLIIGLTITVRRRRRRARPVVPDDISELVEDAEPAAIG